MRPIMKSVVGVKQRDDDIDIQQRAHDLDAFFVAQVLNVLKRDNFAA